MLTCESFIHNSDILFINKHVFSIIVCLFIITIDNNSFLSLISRAVVHNNNNIIVIKEARGFKENSSFGVFVFFFLFSMEKAFLICTKEMAKRESGKKTSVLITKCFYVLTVLGVECTLCIF
jgi:hypothetical protein